MSDIENQDLYDGTGSDTPLIDSLGSAVKRLIDKGKIRGYITVEELNKALPPERESSENIEDIMSGISDMGISIIAPPSELNVPYMSKLRDLLSLVGDIDIAEPSRRDECCGFGGMFSVEENAVSVCMGRDKVRDHMATGAEYITGADSSCLMHMQGVIDHDKLPIRTIHAVEILNSKL